MTKALAVKKIGFTNYYTASIQIGLLVSVLYFTSLHNYLLFHSLVELAGVIISGIIFLVVWNARRYIDNGYFIFLGITLLFAAGLSLLHTLSYKGMTVFSSDANIPTQLWIANRYMVAISFLLAPSFIKKKIDIPLTILFYSAAFVLVFLSIFYWKSFPVAYIEGTGLTDFKIISEYAIAIILGAAALLVNANAKAFEPRTRKIIILSLVASIASEITFTDYANVYGPANLVGHLFLIISYYLLYLGIIEIALRKPSHNFYRNLIMSREAIKQNEEKLKRINEYLEEKVQSRTYDLKKINETLNARNILMKLAAETFSRKIFLNEVVKLIKEWTGCELVGIRILNESGNIPYNAHSGFSQNFLESENWLSTKKGECVCTRVFTGKSEPQDLKMMSYNGSYFCNDLEKFHSELSNEEKNRFRMACLEQGYSSLAVIPIWHGNKTLGVIHITEKERNKLSESSIDFLESISPLIGNAINKYNTQESLDKSKRALEVLSGGNHILVHAKNEKELLHNVTKMIVNEGGYSVAWIGYKNKDAEDEPISIEAYAGIEKATIKEMLKKTIDFGKYKGSPLRVLDSGETQVRQDILTNPEYAFLRDTAIKYKFKSSLAVPLKNNNSAFGSLTILAKESVAFDKNEIKLLEELASDMSYGINTLRLRKSKERSDRELIESYNHLGMLNRKISVLLDLDKTARNKKDAGSYILETAISLSQADLGMLYKFDEEGKFVLLASRGVGKKVDDDMKIFNNEAYKFLNLLVRKQSMIEVRSDAYDLGCFNVNEKIRCYLIIPLSKKKIGKLKGAIFLGYSNDKKLYNQELEFYSVFERHASSALFNAKVL